MRSIRRLLAATAAGVALTAASIAVAGPAAASPEDGQGCVGTPTIPASYVCLISLTPANALPGTSTDSIPVDVPPVCYFLDCTDATTVHVPVPEATLNDGDIAVLWYQGQSYPIGIALGGAVVGLALDTVDYAGAVAREALADGLRLVGQELEDTQEIVGRLGEDVNEAIDDLPTTAELLAEIRGLIRPYQDAVREIADNLPTTEEIVDALQDNDTVQYVLWLVQQLREADWCSFVAGVGTLVTGDGSSWSC